MSADTVPAIRHLLKISQALGFLFRGNAPEATRVAQVSVSVAGSSVDIIKGNLCIAKSATYIPNAEDERVTSYSQALTLAQQTNSLETIPLVDYIEVGKVLIHRGRYVEALESLLLGCRIYPSSSLFNLVGICCLRLDKMIDAEDALQEANLIDNRNPEVWAYLSVLCLSTGGHRMEEAERSCQQALRLGLTNAGVLREMATAYIAVDKLRSAEELIRRAMACDMADGSNKPTPHTRRLLGDVLAGQNQAAQAIEEYQSVIEDESADMATRIAAGENCITLLSSLGRNEELETLESIVSTLKGE